MYLLSNNNAYASCAHTLGVGKFATLRSHLGPPCISHDSRNPRVSGTPIGWLLNKVYRVTDPRFHIQTFSISVHGILYFFFKLYSLQINNKEMSYFRSVDEKVQLEVIEMNGRQVIYICGRVHSHILFLSANFG